MCNIFQQSLPGNCYNHGYVYDIEKILDLFGQNLPCCLYNGVLDLYKLTTYPEKAMAAAFTIAVTPDAQGLFAFYDVNLLEVRKEYKSTLDLTILI